MLGGSANGPSQSGLSWSSRSQCPAFCILAIQNTLQRAKGAHITSIHGGVRPSQGRAPQSLLLHGLSSGRRGRPASGSRQQVGASRLLSTPSATLLGLAIHASSLSKAPSRACCKVCNGQVLCLEGMQMYAQVLCVPSILLKARQDSHRLLGQRPSAHRILQVPHRTRRTSIRRLGQGLSRHVVSRLPQSQQHALQTCFNK